MEKIKMKEYLANLPTEVPSKLIGLDSNGSDIVSTPQQIIDTTDCLQMKSLYGTMSESYYCKIVTMALSGSGASQEGNLNNIVLKIVGGGTYVVPNNLLYLSLVCHREAVTASKNSIIGDLEIGYIKNNATIEIWTKTRAFSNTIYVSILGRISRNTLINNVYQKTVPEGYTVIN